MIKSCLSSIRPAIPPGLSLTISPPSILMNNLPAGSFTTMWINAVASYGEEPYTYLWEFVSGHEWTLTDPVQQQVKISGIGAPWNSSEPRVYNSTYKCAVTDNNSDVAVQFFSMTLVFR